MMMTKEEALQILANPANYTKAKLEQAIAVLGSGWAKRP